MTLDHQIDNVGFSLNRVMAYSVDSHRGSLLSDSKYASRRDEYFNILIVCVRHVEGDTQELIVNSVLKTTRFEQLETDFWAVAFLEFVMRGGLFIKVDVIKINYRKIHIIHNNQQYILKL